MSAAQQLGEEIIDRLGVVALLDPAIARAAIADAVTVAPGWATALVDPDNRERLAAGVYEALWPAPPPPEWWATDLGRALVTAGISPPGDVSVTEAAAVLGCSERTARRKLGAGKHALADVVGHLIACETADSPCD